MVVVIEMVAVMVVVWLVRGVMVTIAAVVVMGKTG